MYSPRSGYRHRITVSEADIDDLGHVNNAVYLRYVEEVVRAHAVHVGVDMDTMRRLGVVPVVRRHLITYHRSALLGEELEVSTQIIEARGIRAKRHNQVCQAASGVLLVEAETDWVWVDAVSGRPKPVPPAIMEAFGWPSIK